MNTSLERLEKLSSKQRAVYRLLLSKKGEETAARAQINPLSRESNSFPLSFAQQRMWIIKELQPDSPVYNIPLPVSLRGQLDVRALKASLNEVARRHESLRVSFMLSDDEPRQVISLVRQFDLQVIDLTGLSEGVRAGTAQALVTEDYNRPFNLRQPPLFRAALLVTGEKTHILMLTIHHIISDDWSIGILAREIATLYGAFSNGERSPLPELEIQYVDFAHWQRQWLQGEVLEEQLSYWGKQLSGSLPTLELPTDRPRPAVQSFRGATHPVYIPEKLSESLRAISREGGATLFMTLLAAFQALLHRYSGQNDIIVGTPIANRKRVEVEAVVGFFVNMLALRTDFSGNPSFRDLIGRVRAVTVGAYAHQDLSFEQLVEKFQPERSLSHSPLFQVSMVLQNGPGPAQNVGAVVRPEASSLQWSPYGVSRMTAKFDLTLNLLETTEGIMGALEYSTALFEAATIERMTGHFLNLLQAIVNNPRQPIRSLPMLGDDERRQLVVEWNQTAHAYPQDTCIHQLFEAQVGRTPDAVAVVFQGRQLSYRELNERANRLSNHLQRRGVGPEMSVGILMQRSIEMVVGLLGVLKAGGAYVPLDASYPAERLAYMMEDAALKVLLTQRHLVDRFSERTGVGMSEVICLDDQWEAISLESAENPANRASSQNLAYVIYTSGSTGQPKGVMIPHNGLVNYLSWSERAYPLALGSGAPVHSSLAFDLTVTSLLAPLLAGKAVTLLAEEHGIEALAAALREGGDFSLIKITPSHLEALNHRLGATEVSNKAHALVIGGEPLRAQHLQLWREHAPQTRLINEYGPTETVVGCCTYEVGNEDETSGAIPIGRPIANTRLCVLEYGGAEPCPVGVIGELYIGGEGVARGYLGRPEMTAERFVPDGVSGEAGQRLYRTGDLVRHRADGNLEYVGRVDEQVKVRGYRIETGEIAAVLLQHAFVSEAAVLVREDVVGDKRLVAYVVSVEGAALVGTKLRQYLKGKLPEHMVPTSYVMLERMPLTSNGKVDRRALPAPGTLRPGSEIGFEPPSTPVEALLAEIWSQILRIEKIGIHDDFFHLGGYSLLAMQVMSRVRESFPVELSLRELFENPTIAELAAVITEAQTAQERIEEGQLTEALEGISVEELTNIMNDVREEQNS